MKKFQCLVLFAFFCLGHTLTCYDCEPTAEGNCRSPTRSNNKITHCDESGSKKLSLRSGQLSYECFTIKYESRHDRSQNGIYRGCIEKPHGQSSCDHLRHTLSNGHVSSCEICSRDNCNGHVFHS